MGAAAAASLSFMIMGMVRAWSSPGMHSLCVSYTEKWCDHITIRKYLVYLSRYAVTVRVQGSSSYRVGHFMD